MTEQPKRPPDPAAGWVTGGIVTMAAGAVLWGWLATTGEDGVTWLGWLVTLAGFIVTVIGLRLAAAGIDWLVAAKHEQLEADAARARRAAREAPSDSPH